MLTNSCCPIKDEDYVGRLLAHSAGRLDRDAAAQLQQHLETCPSCMAMRGSQSALWQALDLWETPEVSSDFNRRLYARIDAAAAMPWYSRWLERVSEAMRPVFAQPAFPLTAAVVLIATGFLFDHPASTVTRISHSAVSAIEAEQVEKTLDDLEMLRQFDLSGDGKMERQEKPSKSM